MQSALTRLEDDLGKAEYELECMQQSYAETFHKTAQLTRDFRDVAKALSYCNQIIKRITRAKDTCEISLHLTEDDYRHTLESIVNMSGDYAVDIHSLAHMLDAHLKHPLIAPYVSDIEGGGDE